MFALFGFIARGGTVCERSQGSLRNLSHTFKCVNDPSVLAYSCRFPWNHFGNSGVLSRPHRVWSPFVPVCSFWSNGMCSHVTSDTRKGDLDGPPQKTQAWVSGSGRRR